MTAGDVPAASGRRFLAAVSWLMAARLSGLDLDSPATFAWVALVQVTIVVAAASVPGLRASRANALATLRAE